MSEASMKKLKEENEILRGQCVLVTKDTVKFKNQIINWMIENEKLRNENKKMKQKLDDMSGKG